MRNYKVAFLLLDLTKNEMRLCQLLDLLTNSDTEPRVYKTEQIQELIGITKSNLIKALTTLENKNVVGKLVYDEGLVEKRIAKGFSKDFMRTIINTKNAVEQAIGRVGYRIVDDDGVYVYNPLVKSWKYPAKAKVLKAIKNYDGLFDKASDTQDFINYLKKSLKKGRKCANSDINGWNIYSSIQLFVKKYKEVYNANYVIDEKLEYRLMKNVLTILSSNDVANRKLGMFFDYAFKKGKSRKKPVHISSLKYYANEFVTNVVTKDEDASDFYYDDNGRLHRKKGV